MLLWPWVVKSVASDRAVPLRPRPSSREHHSLCFLLPRQLSPKTPGLRRVPPTPSPWLVSAASPQAPLLQEREAREARGPIAPSSVLSTRLARPLLAPEPCTAASSPGPRLGGRGGRCPRSAPSPCQAQRRPPGRRLALLSPSVSFLFHIVLSGLKEKKNLCFYFPDQLAIDKKYKINSAT